jgi:hypothetical protein
MREFRNTSPVGECRVTFAERRLREGVARLPEPEKLYAALSFFEGLPDEQIALQLGSTEVDIARLREGATGRLWNLLPVDSGEARSLVLAAEKALRASLAELSASPLDEAGRVADIDDAFLDTVPEPARVAAIADVSQGDGGELRVPPSRSKTKAPRFHSARSSCALPVNAFGPWKLDCESLVLVGIDGFRSLQFERRCPIEGVPDNRKPPNLDVLIHGDTFVAVESKLIEHITAETTASLSTTYDAPLRALAHPAWQNAFGRLRESPNEFQSFGAAQLIKHYLGIRSQFPDSDAVLVYLFWEPTDFEEHRFFSLHRAEVAEFATWVSDGDVPFRWLSYRELFDNWRGLTAPPWLKRHVNRLDARYKVTVAPLIARIN